MSFEVDTPILNSPFAEPAEHWFIRPGHPAEPRAGRRPAMVFQPRDQRDPWDVDGDLMLERLPEYDRAYGLRLVNLVRQRLARWQADGRPGATVAARLDKSPHVRAFVKNEFLGFAIPYIHNGQDHEYYPDYLVRLRHDPAFTLILEVKGRPDPEEQVKAQAARRWVDAVNAEGSFGRWGYAVVRDPKETGAVIEAWVGEMERCT